MKEQDKIRSLVYVATAFYEGDGVQAYLALIEAARSLLMAAHDHALFTGADDEGMRAAVLFALLGDCRRNVPDIPTKGD